MFIFHLLLFPCLFILMSLNIISKLMTPKLDYQPRTLSSELLTHIFNCLLNLSRCLVDIKNLTYLNWDFWSYPLPIPGNSHTILPFLRLRMEPSLVPLFCPVPEQSFTRSSWLLLTRHPESKLFSALPRYHHDPSNLHLTAVSGPQPPPLSPGCTMSNNLPSSPLHLWPQVQLVSLLFLSGSLKICCFLS